MTLESARNVQSVYPVLAGEVSCGYWQKRPLSVPVEARTYRHRSWDVVKRNGAAECMKDVNILSEEAGEVVFQCGYRSPNADTPVRKAILADQTYPDGRWFWASNYYHDNYGCIVHLYGKSGLIYTHCHVEDAFFWHLVASKLGTTLPWRVKRDAYNQYVQMLLTLTQPISVEAGEAIARIGDSGYSEAPHLHLEVRIEDRFDARIDPAALWPQHPIRNNDLGPSMGEWPHAPEKVIG